MKYDVVIFGGGTAGIACAYIAAKYKLKTLLVEKTDVLGGTITQGLVTPSMNVNTENINTEFFNDLLTFADKYNARHTFVDGNKAWFNHELLKIVFDDMLTSYNCDILFSSEPININFDSISKMFIINLSHKILSLYIDTKYIVDATANGKIFQILNCDFQNKNQEYQNPSMRFIISGINVSKFEKWITDIDNNRNVTISEKNEQQIYMSTACTWDLNKNWALSPIFESALKNGDLQYEDTAYFQLFSIHGMPDSFTFNCPRIILKEGENPLNPFTYSKSVIQGRKKILRLYNFCVKYLPGFEKSYISHISDILGIRESYRVKGQYTFTKSDIISGKKPKNIALSCDYPIDIHSNNKQKDILEFTNHSYYLPIEALISNKYENLLAVGRIVSADFYAQGAIRTQLSCFSMGEAAAKFIAKKNK